MVRRERASGLGLRASDVGPRASGFGPRAPGVGPGATGLGPRAPGFGPRATRASGYGRRAPSVALVVALSLALSGMLSAQQVAFEEAVRNLRHPDLRTRLSAVKQLGESRYPEAAVPVAQAITDVEDAVQLEAIDAELRLFLATRAESGHRAGVVVEIRGRNLPQRAFAAGPDALAPRVVPPEIPLALASVLKDRSASVRLAAVYAFGVFAPASPEFRPVTLQDAAGVVALMIRQDEAAIREGSALVAGRVWKDCGSAAASASGCAVVGDALIDGMNDGDEGIQWAAMDSLGQLRYGPAAKALADRFTYHRRGRAAEIALNALSRTGHSSSVPLFRTLLEDRREAARLLGIEGLARAGDRSSLQAIQRAGARKPSAEIDLAVAYAEQKLGAAPRLEPIARCLAGDRTRAVAQEYLVDLGPAASRELSAYLQDSDPLVRGGIARVLARIGDSAVLPQVEPLLRDPDPRVAEIASLAVARLKASSR